MPVITKKKIESEGIPNGLIEERARELDAVISNNAQEIKPGEASNKETNVTFRLTEQEKKDYKTFFASQNISLSFGIKLAIEHLILDVKAGKGTIKRTGYFEH